MPYSNRFAKKPGTLPRAAMLTFCAGVLVAGVLCPPVMAQEKAPAPTYASTGDAKVVEEIIAAEKALRGTRDNDAAKAALYVSNFKDVHGSGWLYNKEQSIELGQNQRKIWPTEPWKIIKAFQHDLKIDAYGSDTAVVTGVSETYVEVPNPEDVAIAAGTLTRDPVATAKAIANKTPANTEGPGEIDRPNPYRVRFVRVWVHQAGQWKLAMSQSTRIGGRDGHVTLEN